MSREERKTAQIWASIEKMQRKEEDNQGSSDASGSDRQSKRKRIKKKSKRDDEALTMHKSDCQSWRSFVPPKKKWVSMWEHNHPRVAIVDTVSDVKEADLTSPKEVDKARVPQILTTMETEQTSAVSNVPTGTASVPDPMPIVQEEKKSLKVVVSEDEPMDGEVVENTTVNSPPVVQTESPAKATEPTTTTTTPATSDVKSPREEKVKPTGTISPHSATSPKEQEQTIKETPPVAEETKQPARQSPTAKAASKPTIKQTEGSHVLSPQVSPSPTKSSPARSTSPAEMQPTESTSSNRSKTSPRAESSKKSSPDRQKSDSTKEEPFVGEMNALGSRRKRKSLWDVGDPRLGNDDAKDIVPTWQTWITSTGGSTSSYHSYNSNSNSRRYQPYIQPRGRSWSSNHSSNYNR
ncbi:hypothetical protein THRCLA_20568 [Thraustotheca clavata]|uniref:Uncharacterized protein n=1 Tax=Thraustotheca clavata TaxID=74557 RepID=A0A1W0A5X9_9STRA|nr:hypothetical protein THRCLA_20568 [Thraustotheca clavata]